MLPYTATAVSVKEKNNVINLVITHGYFSKVTALQYEMWLTWPVYDLELGASAYEILEDIANQTDYNPDHGDITVMIIYNLSHFIGMQYAGISITLYLYTCGCVYILIALCK